MKFKLAPFMTAIVFSTLVVVHFEAYGIEAFIIGVSYIILSQL